VGLAAALVLGCCDDPPPEDPPDPFFPADYAESYELVRDCRLSIDHDLTYIVVHANEVAAQIYQDEEWPLPDGSLLVKAGYDDDLCTSSIAYWAMMKVAGVWRWQQLEADRRVVSSGEVGRCVSCHSDCGDGRDSTCTDPP
jgi:hypothetical protein